MTLRDFHCASHAFISLFQIIAVVDNEIYLDRLDKDRFLENNPPPSGTLILRHGRNPALCGIDAPLSLKN